MHTSLARRDLRLSHEVALIFCPPPASMKKRQGLVRAKMTWLQLGTVALSRARRLSAQALSLLKVFSHLHFSIDLTSPFVTTATDVGGC